MSIDWQLAWRVVPWTVAVLCAASAASAQTLTWSVGPQVSGVRLRALGEGPFGVGVRVTAESGRVGVDAEADLFPENPSGNFGERLWLAGGRLRLMGDRLAWVARARAGGIAFAGAFFDLRLSDRTHAAYDLGITAERAGRRVILRVDIGDLIIPFGGATYLIADPPGPVSLGVTHNLRTSVGVSVRLGGDPSQTPSVR